MDQGRGWSKRNPAWGQATRILLGRPNPSMRLSAWMATATSVARRSSVCARNASPITCFHLFMVASARERLLYPDAFCGSVANAGFGQAKR